TVNGFRPPPDSRPPCPRRRLRATPDQVGGRLSPACGEENNVALRRSDVDLRLTAERLHSCPEASSSQSLRCWFATRRAPKRLRSILRSSPNRWRRPAPFPDSTR